MPKLKCSVQTCMHNHQFLCDLDQIQVGGDQGLFSERDTVQQFCRKK